MIQVYFYMAGVFLGVTVLHLVFLKVHGALQEDSTQEQQTSANGTTQAKPAPKRSEAAVEDKLLRWVQDSIEG